MTTAVPNIEFTERGPVAPSEAAILAGMDTDWTTAFNGTLNTAPTTPAGQVIASETAILGDNYDQQVLLYNSVDPAYATGRMQDAIGRIYFLTRNPAQSSVLQIACGGAQGVVIPVGALIQDNNGALWACTEAGRIPVGGSITLAFASQIMGPVPIPETISIYQTVPQWNTVSIVSGVLGNVVESRAEFEARREASVAGNATGFPAAVQGALVRVPGVIDWYVIDNTTPAPVTVGGVTIGANSMYVCVAGGDAQAVAYAIWTKKSPGCGWTGNTTQVVYDQNSGYSPPYPAYSVSFQTPADAPICFQVSITNSVQVPANAAQLVQAAVLAAFYGQDGGTRARIGSTIYASRFYPGIAALGTWATQIISILIGTDANPGATFTGTITGTALATASTVGTINIGDFVFGSGVAPGTIITGGSGSSWTVSINQTVVSEAMSSVTANANDITIGIGEIPTLDPANVNLVLV